MFMERDEATARIQSWRQREEYTSMFLTGRGWAWQILRRNPKFQEQMAEVRSSLLIVNETPHLRVIAGPTHGAFTERWGTMFVECARDGQEPVVLWNPVLSTSVLRIAAFKATHEPSNRSFDIRNLECTATLFCTPDGLQHLLVQDAGHELQIVIRGADIRKPVHLLFDGVAPSTRVKSYFEALRGYNQLLNTGRLSSAPIQIDKRSSRLQIVLQALDGYLAGASHRDIASALFGQHRVDEIWNDPNELLRSRVRHAVRRARLLMDGGYLRFLR